MGTAKGTHRRTSEGVSEGDVTTVHLSSMSTTTDLAQLQR